MEHEQTCNIKGKTCYLRGIYFCYGCNTYYCFRHSGSHKCGTKKQKRNHGSVFNLKNIG
jgi:hypothetical protein